MYNHKLILKSGEVRKIRTMRIVDIGESEHVGVATEDGKIIPNGEYVYEDTVGNQRSVRIEGHKLTYID